jgi:hypothetical protein
LINLDPLAWFCVFFWFAFPDFLLFTGNAIGFMFSQIYLIFF